MRGGGVGGRLLDIEHSVTLAWPMTDEYMPPLPVYRVRPPAVSVGDEVRE